MLTNYVLSILSLNLNNCPRHTPLLESNLILPDSVSYVIFVVFAVSIKSSYILYTPHNFRLLLREITLIWKF